jgi:hypothetical protein
VLWSERPCAEASNSLVALRLVQPQPSLQTDTNPPKATHTLEPAGILENNRQSSHKPSKSGTKRWKSRLCII